MPSTVRNTSLFLSGASYCPFFFFFSSLLFFPLPFPGNFEEKKNVKRKRRRRKRRKRKPFRGLSCSSNINQHMHRRSSRTWASPVNRPPCLAPVYTVSSRSPLAASSCCSWPTRSGGGAPSSPALSDRASACFISACIPASRHRSQARRYHRKAMWRWFASSCLRCESLRFCSSRRTWLIFFFFFRTSGSSSLDGARLAGFTHPRYPALVSDR